MKTKNPVNNKFHIKPISVIENSLRGFANVSSLESTHLYEGFEYLRALYLHTNCCSNLSLSDLDKIETDLAQTDAFLVIGPSDVPVEICLRYNKPIFTIGCALNPELSARLQKMGKTIYQFDRMNDFEGMIPLLTLLKKTNVSNPERNVEHSNRISVFNIMHWQKSSRMNAHKIANKIY